MYFYDCIVYIPYFCEINKLIAFALVFNSYMKKYIYLQSLKLQNHKLMV